MRWWAILLPAAVLPIALPHPAWFDSYLLSSPAIFRGTVVDKNDEPLSGVSISGVENNGEFALRLDVAENGHFNLRTRSPSLVFRKDGFQSRFVRVSSSEDGRVELDTVTAAPLPECSSKARCGEGDMFCIPDRHGLG
ncbi:MAG TPA: carboxypeptidase-like regulatory domain-containing protein, partial [Bryobacteraceae bacterium]|nr:carboxypeptidase-like regulatory domain-containing protein [Bryobacteraceae bacterium]